MPDITMCKGERNGYACRLRENCRRYKSKPNPYRQSWLRMAPFEDLMGEQTQCEMYWEIRRDV